MNVVEVRDERRTDVFSRSELLPNLLKPLAYETFIQMGPGFGNQRIDAAWVVRLREVDIPGVLLLKLSRS